MITGNGTQFDNQPFDFVVVGGGTAGLALAARLSEDTSVTVLVLEAGGNHLDDPKITIPAQFTATLGDPKYDWNFKTVPQKHLKDRVIGWSRGKGLGGTSAINFHSWTKPPAADMDAIEKLGNPGWNWESFYHYFRKSETFTPPDEEQSKLYPYTYDSKLRGSSGPVQATIPQHTYTVDDLFSQTLTNLGARKIYDPSGGDISGSWTCSSNLDRKTWTRSYAASAYLLPANDRRNLTAVTGAYVSRVLFADQVPGQDLVANKVEFTQDGKTYSVLVRKEVILSAGTVKSPQLLELSGIGQSERLKKLGIEPKVNLPGVGENVQDHLLSGLVYELRPEGKHQTFDLLADPEFAIAQMQLHAQGLGMFRSGVTAFSYLPLATMNPTGVKDYIASAQKQVADIKATASELPDGLSEQLDIQLEVIQDPSLPDLEIVAFPGNFSPTVRAEAGKTYVSILPVVQHPFSRGSIHVVTANPLDDPEIDPRCSECGFDTESFVEAFKFARRVATTEPMKSAITGVELEPGPQVKTDDQLRDWILSNYTGSWHSIGSCSMLPKDKNGVVDPELKVYGTSNLRVVDLSVIPLHFASHPQTVAYAVAEKAADIIKAAHGLGGTQH